MKEGHSMERALRRRGSQVPGGCMPASLLSDKDLAQVRECRGDGGGPHPPLPGNIEP